MSPTTEKFRQLSTGDKFRLLVSFVYLLLGSLIILRGFRSAWLPFFIGLVFVAFGAYRLFYFYRYFKKIDPATSR